MQNLASLSVGRLQIGERYMTQVSIARLSQATPR